MSTLPETVFGCAGLTDQSVYGADGDLSDSQLQSLAEVKRLLERWSIDDRFREYLRENPASAIASLNLSLVADEVQSLWDPQWIGSESDFSEIARLYHSFSREKLVLRDQMRGIDGEPDHPRFKKWRQRQMNRFYRQAGIQEAAGVVHATFAIELNDGCSVGCWFCGVDAPPLTKSYDYTDEQAALWRSVLQALHHTIGKGAQIGFCYWATDPFDNPDYEKFLLDFRSEFGRYPQTTTAQPLRDVDRIRALLHQTSGLEKTINRFSILSRSVLDDVHRKYNARELLHVELVPQNKEAMAVKAHAGRARARTGPSPKTPHSSTIACVSGFLINMVRGDVRLISPVPASDRWPLGYRIYGQRSFVDAEGFSNALNELIATGMKRDLSIDDPVLLCNAISASLEGDQVRLDLGRCQYRFDGCANPSLALQLVELLKSGPISVGEVMEKLESEAPLAEIYRLINILFSAGLIDDESFIDT